MDAISLPLNTQYALEGVIPFAFPRLPNIGCVFTTAGAGNLSLDVSLDTEGLRRTQASRHFLQRQLGFTDWVELKQVHGDKVLVDPEPTPLDEPSTLEADGSATATPRRALVIKTADCQPILLAHKSGKHVAALHVGWRGNVLDFPRSGVEAFCRAYDLRSEDVLAVRGPSLGPGAAEFVNFAKEWPERFRPWFDEATRTMHLWELTRAALESVGLRRNNIFGLDLCTQSLPELFFSFRRRDDVRQMSLIWIRE